MNKENLTIAIKVSEEIFNRVGKYSAKVGLTKQKYMTMATLKYIEEHEDNKKIENSQ